ncbi:MAG: SURF1 family protein [Gammaproteobacteria bacterium]
MRTLFRHRSFRPGLVPTLAMLPLLALLLWLGFWQWGRAAEKQALLDGWADRTAAQPVALPPPADADQRYLRVTAAGHYLTGRQILLDNQTRAGRAGYRVLTPFRTADGTVVMVDRGWVPLPGNAREQLPDVTVAPSPRVVVGRLEGFRRAGLDAPVQPLVPVPDGQPRVMNYPDAASVAAAVGAPVYPAVLRLDPGAPEGFLLDEGPAIEFGPERHRGYAVQWWALALTLVLLWGWTAWKPAAAAG